MKFLYLPCSDLKLIGTLEEMLRNNSQTKFNTCFSYVGSKKDGLSHRFPNVVNE